jgi:hypothetical protein
MKANTKISKQISKQASKHVSKRGGKRRKPSRYRLGPGLPPCRRRTLASAPPMAERIVVAALVFAFGVFLLLFVRIIINRDCSLLAVDPLGCTYPRGESWQRVWEAQKRKALERYK